MPQLPASHTNIFDLPDAQKDYLDKALRDFVAKDEPLESVRPSRNPKLAKQMIVPDAPVDQSVELPKTVPIIEASPTPHGDPEAISISLPSKFHFYPFKDLYIKPFRLFHLSKLAKANSTGSLQTIAEAVSSVLYAPGFFRNDIAFHLTMADFNAVLYWLRLNSFTKKQMRVTSTCQNPDHHKAVEDGLKPEESLNITTIYSNTDIVYTDLEEAPNPDKYFITYEGERLQLQPENISQVVQFLDHPRWNEEEFQYSAKIAAVIPFVDDKGKPLSLAKKVELAETALSADDALLALEYADLLEGYGVVETIKTKCMECGASGEAQLAVDAPSFLSPVF